MSERQIKVCTVEDVLPGHYVTTVDSDEWQVGAIVPADAYLAEEQDWQHVVAKTGAVDVPTFTLADHNGDEYTSRWQATATVWVLVEADGLPTLVDARHQH